ncbi:MAG: 4'-phosphopantetheinyl transferase superfamily protein [Alsobacter sp.]
MSQGTPRPLPGPGLVEVWTWPIAGDGVSLGRLAAWLSPEEAGRAQRFLRPEHGDAFRAARGGLRAILASYLGCRPSDVTFAVGPHGKPQLDRPALPDLRFNLSHSGGLAALGVVVGPEIGVDIEAVRPVEPQVAERFFARGERERLARLRGEAWTRGFHRCWTRKEAVLKAMGDGLAVPLDAFDVGLSDEDPVAVLAARPPVPQAESWTLLSFQPRAGIEGAVALRSARRHRLVQLPWEPDRPS